MNALIVFAFLLTYSINYAASLECYECSSDPNNSKDPCSDPIDTNVRKEVCTELNPVCMKIRRKVKTTASTIEVLVRGCYSNTTDTCKDYEKVLNGQFPPVEDEDISYSACKECSGNLCNFSPSVASSMVISILALIYVKLF